MRPFSRSILFPALILLAGCGSSTRVVNSWKAPGASVKAGHHKLLVIALIKDEAARRIAEDRMVSFMHGRGVTSYSYLGSDQNRINEAGMSARMQKDSIDGVLIMRLVDQQTEQTYVPGVTSMGYYGGAWGYYGYAYPMYSTPGYIQTDHTYFVETNLYSIDHKGPLWTCTTSTLNPTEVGSTIDDIMTVVYQRMKQDGFVVSDSK